MRLCAVTSKPIRSYPGPKDTIVSAATKGTMTMTDLVLTCPDCGGRWNGRNVTHAHTGGTMLDERFMSCNRCHGVGAMTCERCQGTGRIVLRNGVQRGTYAKPATSPVLGPNPKKLTPR